MSDVPLRLVVVGGGNMGASMVQGVIGKGLFDAKEIMVIEPDVVRQKKLSVDLGVCVCGNHREYEALCGTESGIEVLLWAIKPQIAEVVVPEYGHLVNKETVILSCMAGIALSKLEAWLDSKRNDEIQKNLGWQIVRFMPNLPAQIGHSMSVYYLGSNVSSQGRKLAQEFLCSFGQVLEVVKEELVNSATAVAGSGTGYVAYILENYIVAACELGFTTDEAITLVYESMMGALLLWKHRQIDPAVLRREVTSPGGTTEAAIRVFQEAGLGDILRAGIHQACARALELAK
jgi:pyrroline-5-carboxylate reductase